MPYTELQVRSSVSLLTSPIQIKPLVERARAAGYRALALTDVNIVTNLVPFYDAMRAAGMTPLLGVHVVLPDDDFLLIAMTNQGYRQLLKVSTALQLTTTTLADLPDFTDLLCVTTPAGALARTYATGDGVQAAAVGATLVAKHPWRLAIGVPLESLDLDLLRFAELHDWLALPLGDVRALDAVGARTRLLLRAIATGARLQLMENDGDYLLQDPQLVADRLRVAGATSLLDQLDRVVGAVDVTLTSSEPALPHFPTPDGQETTGYLRQLAVQGLGDRVGMPLPPQYDRRLAHELNVIDDMGFADYFLIVQDIVSAAKSRGVVTGPGRGSAAGSLVAYALGITTVDPLPMNLLFERFLNPNRHQMPDIDIDVADTQREQVLTYLQGRYGADHCAQIMAQGTFGARQAMQDASRALGLPQYRQDELKRALPKRFDTLEEVVANRQVARLMHQDEVVAAVMHAAEQLEGLPRTVTTHAAGVVLSAGVLTDTVALMPSSVGMGVQTQLPKEGVERAGLLKIDILGLRTLSILDQMRKAWRQDQGTTLDFETIDLNDPDALSIFTAGDTTGIFQFESRPMKDALRQVAPQSFEDVVAVAALYRPGPMQYLGEFAQRRHGQVPVTYRSDLLAPILAPTYGIIVYQEQVMQVASVVGGFTMAEADDLRRAMSKKKVALIDAARPRFIAGAKARGVGPDDAAAIFADIERFAGYGFNRSHAVAYGKLAVQMAYVKAHAPRAFYVAVMNASVGSRDKLAGYVREARRKGITIIGPRVNEAGRQFRLAEIGIQLGLLSVRGLRRDLVTAILEERQLAGPYQDLQDFLLRLPAKYLQANVLMPIVAAGGLDDLGLPRHVVLRHLEDLVGAAALAAGSRDLLTAVWPKLDVTDGDVAATLSAEADVLGFYLAGHPVTQYAELAEKIGAVPLRAVKGTGSVTVIVLVEGVRVINTKTGAKMAFLTVSDETGQAEVTLFPEAYLQARGISAGTVYVMRVTLDKQQRRQLPQLLGRRVQLAETLRTAQNQQLFLNLGANPDEKMKKLVWQTLLKHHGLTPVIVVSADSKLLLDERYAVTVDAELRAKLTDILGPEALAIREAAK